MNTNRICVKVKILVVNLVRHVCLAVLVYQTDLIHIYRSCGALNLLHATKIEHCMLVGAKMANTSTQEKESVKQLSIKVHILRDTFIFYSPQFQFAQNIWLLTIVRVYVLLTFFYLHIFSNNILCFVKDLCTSVGNFCLDHCKK